MMMFVFNTMTAKTISQKDDDDDDDDLFLLDLSLKEIDANGFFVVLGEDAFAVALNHAGLAHGAVPNYYHLDRHLHLTHLAHPAAAAWAAADDDTSDSAASSSFSSGESCPGSQ